VVVGYVAKPEGEAAVDALGRRSGDVASANRAAIGSTLLRSIGINSPRQ